MLLKSRVIRDAETELKKQSALIDRKYNDDVELLYKEINSRMEILRGRREDQLMACLKKYLEAVETPQILIVTGIYELPDRVAQCQ